MVKQELNSSTSTASISNDILPTISPILISPDALINGSTCNNSCDDSVMEYEFNDNDADVSGAAYKDYLKSEGQIDLLHDLRVFALERAVKLNAVTDLLKILKKHGVQNIVTDGRTLLKTPTTIAVSKMGESGDYYYDGIEHHIVNCLSQLQLIPSKIKLIINMDGIPAFESNSLNFWPIQFLIADMPFKPRTAAIYFGRGKVPIEEFLSPFVDELKTIMDNGIIVSGSHVKVGIKAFVCDTPARCYIKGIIKKIDSTFKINLLLYFFRYTLLQF